MQYKMTTTPQAHTSEQLHTILDSLFFEASASQYIAAINTFVRQRIETATPDKCSRPLPNPKTA
jgi:hypothetical protein